MANYMPLLLSLLEAAGLPLPEAEVRVCPERRWKFDFAWPQQRVALEIEGGAWVMGRHNRAPGFLADMEKYNAAVVNGWRLLRTTPDTLPDVVPFLVRLLSEEEKNA